MQLTDYLSTAGIDLQLPAGDKAEILTHLVQLLVKKSSPPNPQGILELLKEREELSTTGIGNNVAVPHCKSPDIDKLHICFARSQSPVDFQALDHNPVQLFFLLVAPEGTNSEHLKALAKIARLAKDPQVRNQLLNLSDPAAVLDFLIQKEADFN